MNKQTIVWVLVAVLVLGVVVYYFAYKKKRPSKEGYMSAGAIDHLDSLDSRYEMIEAPEMAIPTEHFADVIDSGDHAKLIEQPKYSETAKPLERLERLQDRSQMPLTASHLPQYNIDVANPSTYSFAVSAPRVQLKDRLNMQADPIRGDVPITYFPDVPLISKSQYDRSSLRLDGYFSDHYKSLYNKLTSRGYRNLPLKINTQGILMDYEK